MLDLERLTALEAKYGVSRSATLHRLRELGMLAEDEARVLRKVRGPAPPQRELAFRLVGESLAHLVADDGARRNGDPYGYEVVPDMDVVP
ncbi:MAG: hypothetical protein ACYDCQ_20395 [Dehalococcoidia bacterium]